jgi:hypothetical protein
MSERDIPPSELRDLETTASHAEYLDAIFERASRPANQDTPALETALRRSVARPRPPWAVRAAKGAATQLLRQAGHRVRWNGSKVTCSTCGLAGALLVVDPSWHVDGAIGRAGCAR